MELYVCFLVFTVNCFAIDVIEVFDKSQLLPATVNLDDMLTPGWFLHSTVVLILANLLDAVACRVDVKFELMPLPAMLVRVAVNGGIETTGSVVRMSGLYH